MNVHVTPGAPSGPAPVPAPQIRASDPEASVFVSANAGSGKTTTLVNRVARLLLDGARPEALLCITYTKAAAAEMQRRLFEVLGQWSVMADDELRDTLAGLEGRSAPIYDADHLKNARIQFARALETPGGLKIQTIHAFCEKLLRRFPIEAGISPGFEVLDDYGAAEVAAEARDALASQTFGEGPVAEAWSRFAVALAFDAFEKMFDTFQQRREALGAWMGRIGGLANLPAEVARLLGFAHGLPDPDAVEQQAASAPALDPGEWRATGRLLSGGTPAQQALGARLHDVAATVANGVPALDAVKSLLLTQAGEPRKGLGRGCGPEVEVWFEVEQSRFCAALERARAARVGWDTVYALTLAGVYVREYEDAKRRRRGLDFADLVDRTRELLTVRAEAAWVLYKLDGGIDHILIDEAQDTAPEQWEMLRALAADFFAGEGAPRDARDTPRSIFIVGDEKQSIFSFQGAEPRLLRREAAWYEERVNAVRADSFRRVPLRESWRSVPEVLEFVDGVFADLTAREALTSGDETADVSHVARRLASNDTGCVDLWPLEREEPGSDQQAWDAPVDQRGPDAWRRLAERIAAEVHDLLERREQVHDRRKKSWRAANPGDVLILVRKRSAMFEEVLRALKRRGVPVAGADRLRLSEHPVFEDCVALIRTVLFPMDDLSLAGVLRSPFCDVDETSLFQLAWARKESLWETLQARRDDSAAWGEAADLIEAVAAEAQIVGPFDLFSRLFARPDARGLSWRARFLTRLGAEAADAIDAFLDELRNMERRGVRELQSAARELSRAGELIIKREMDEPRGEVRVMTAHGAKGLEAPIVILPETIVSREPGGSPLLELPRAGAQGGGFLWCASRGKDCDVSAGAREAIQARGREEDLRLLYVALTRARDRVILAGRAKAPPKTAEEKLKGWYPLVQAAFDRLGDKVRAVEVQDMTVRRFGLDPRRGGEIPEFDGAAAPAPDWLFAPPPPEPRGARWASPTDLAEIAKAPGASPLMVKGGLRRFRRGELIHRLFQILPDVAADQRALTGRAVLAREPGVSDAQAEEMTAAVMAVLDDARFAEVFGPGSRPEVAVAGSAPELPPGVAIAGRLDRLVVRPDRVLVIDYKTNRPAPDRVEDVEPAYLTQMAVYVAVLQALYPERLVEAALVWTDGPRLTPIPQDVIGRVLDDLRRDG